MLFDYTLRHSVTPPSREEVFVRVKASHIKSPTTPRLLRDFAFIPSLKRRGFYSLPSMEEVL